MRENKIVNLSDLEKSVEICVGDKSFVISRLTLQITKLYGEYMVFCGEYAKDVAKTKLLSEESDNLPGLEKLSDDMDKLISNFAIGKAERIGKLLQLILEKNGYEYSQEWWEKNARYQDMEAFIIEALKKDEDSTPKKKLAES